MSLSITEVADALGDAPALLFEDHTVSFSQLAARVATASASLPSRQIVPLIASPTLEALVTLYACLESRNPVALVHPRWSPTEQEHRRALFLRTAPRLDATDESTLALLMTSGTEGTPKIVELSRRAFAAAAAAHAASHGWLPHDRWLLALPFAHVGGLSVITRSLLARKAVALYGDGPFDATRLRARILATEATIVSLVPTQLAQLIDGPPPPTLRTVLLGGAACPPALLSRAAQGGWHVLPSYGMTETCAQIAVGSPGVPLPGVELRVRDEGIEVRSPTLLSAYHGPQGRFSPLDAGGWFRTSDVGTLDAQGRLTIRGRADDVIVTGGEKVHPAEVERLLETLPEIAAACVVGLPEPTWGSILGAALVLRQPLPLGAIEQRVRAGIPGYQRPRVLTLLEALPLNAMGKVDRRAVAASFSAVSPAS